ncbi:MAG: hypothetical protein JWL99_5534, partial [Streptomyces oryziradicis]|nr:hypothetical protein [Actinacidiphila oryziradicis]
MLEPALPCRTFWSSDAPTRQLEPARATSPRRRLAALLEFVQAVEKAGQLRHLRAVPAGKAAEIALTP